jgi:hypothetical protein
MIGGVLSVIGIYLLVNVALLKVLPVSELSSATLPRLTLHRISRRARTDSLTILSVIFTLVASFKCGHDDGYPRHFRYGTRTALLARTFDGECRWHHRRCYTLNDRTAVGLIVSGTFQRLVAMTSFFLAANYCSLSRSHCAAAPRT